MTSPIRNDPFVPSDADAQMAAEASRVLAAFVSSHKELHVELSGDGKKAEVMLLPPSVIGMVQRILTEMANGNAITVMPMNAELTTQVAAEFLNVSRPFIVKQLEAGVIPYRKVGTHRRISVKDLLKYKHEIDRARHGALDALTTESQRLGLGY